MERNFGVDFEVTLWMKMNIFHDRGYVNDLKEEIGNLFSQSIFTRLLCIMLLRMDIMNVLIFWFKTELMWIWKKWGFLFSFWFWQTHKNIYIILLNTTSNPNDSLKHSKHIPQKNIKKTLKISLSPSVSISISLCLSLSLSLSISISLCCW